MKKLLLPTIAALSLASSAAFVQPALATNGMGTHSGVANVFVGCAITPSSSTPLSFQFLQASGGGTINTPSAGSSCADAVAAVEARGLHVVAEETVVFPVTTAAAAAPPAPLLIIHLDNTNTGGNIGGHTGSNFGGNTGGNTGGNSGH